MIQAMGCGFFKNISVITASIRQLGIERYPGQNTKNGIQNSGTRGIDRHIFYLKDETKWLNC
jgi:hypothetical protein